MFHSAAGQTSDSVVPINQFVFIPALIPTDEWFHYAVSYDRTVAKASLYINGVFAGELLLDDLPITNSWAGGARIGHWVDAPFPLRGLMDEFILTNYSMPPEGIVDLYNGTIPPPET